TRAVRATRPVGSLPASGRGSSAGRVVIAGSRHARADSSVGDQLGHRPSAQELRRAGRRRGAFGGSRWVRLPVGRGSVVLCEELGSGGFGAHSDTPVGSANRPLARRCWPGSGSGSGRFKAELKVPSGFGL